MKKKAFYLLLPISILVLHGCKPVNKSQFSDASRIRYLGRVLVKNEYTEFYNSCSGFELKFKGKEVEAEFSSGFGQYLRVYIDNINSGIVEIKDKTVLYSSLKSETHSIKVIRVNSESKGAVRLISLSGFEKIYKLKNNGKLKFEFYGDSITAGYEINNNGTGDSVSNEDGTKTYANLITTEYEAYSNMLCYSGVSLVLPKWINEWVLSERYDQYSFTLNTDKWDFDKFIADYIIVNLGTNDASAINETNKEQFAVGYFNFLKSIRNYNPTAHIVCCYGMMGSNSFIVEGIQKALSDLNDKNSSFLNMTTVECALETSHPTEKGQTDGASQLKHHIDKLIESN